MALKRAAGGWLLSLLVGVAPAAMAASVADGQRAFDAGRFEDARGIWEPLANRGDTEAQLGLALLHELGRGAPQDAALAYAWYRRAAEAGSATAEFNVAVMFDSGRGVTRDAAEAGSWYARAAARGHPRAQFNLAQMYDNGDGVPRNPALAEAWYRAAAATLPAAARRLNNAKSPPRTAAAGARDTMPPAAPAVPANGAGIAAGSDATSLALVWLVPAAAVPVQYFVEVVALDAQGPREVFAGYHDTSAILLNLNPQPAQYAWRVSVVGQDSPHYATGAWSQFAITAE